MFMDYCGRVAGLYGNTLFRLLLTMCLSLPAPGSGKAVLVGAGFWSCLMGGCFCSLVSVALSVLEECGHCKLPGKKFFWDLDKCGH